MHMQVVFLCAWLYVRCSWLVSFISISLVIFWEGWVMFCIHQEISLVDGLKNDLYYVERDINPTQLICLLSWCNLQLLLADCVLRMMDDWNLVIIVITALLKVKCQTKRAVILTRLNSPVIEHLIVNAPWLFGRPTRRRYLLNSLSLVWHRQWHLRMSMSLFSSWLPCRLITLYW